MLNSLTSNMEYSANFITNTVSGELRKKLFSEAMKRSKKRNEVKRQELRKKFDKVSQV